MQHFSAQYGALEENEMRSTRGRTVVDDVSSNVSEIDKEEVALPTTGKRQGRERVRLRLEVEVSKADVVSDETLDLGQQPHRQVVTWLAKRMPPVYIFVKPTVKFLSIRCRDGHIALTGRCFPRGSDACRPRPSPCGTTAVMKPRQKRRKYPTGGVGGPDCSRRRSVFSRRSISKSKGKNIPGPRYDRKTTLVSNARR